MITVCVDTSMIVSEKELKDFVKETRNVWVSIIERDAEIVFKKRINKEEEK